MKKDMLLRDVVYGMGYIKDRIEKKNICGRFQLVDEDW